MKTNEERKRATIVICVITAIEYIFCSTAMNNVRKCDECIVHVLL